MNDASHSRLLESELILREADCAAARMRVEGLPNPVLVQLVAMPLGAVRSLSLYCMYREDTVTFDAIYRFARRPGVDPDALDETLCQYLRTVQVNTQLLDPLLREVGAHFQR